MTIFSGLLQAIRRCLSGIFLLLAALLLSNTMLLQAASAQAPAAVAPVAALPQLDVARLLSVYKLAAGDVITIRVFGEDDLSREKIRLTDAGTIPYPVLGEVKALGLTIGEIERTITKGLDGRYLINPRVSVTIEEYRPFYINGMVERPGGYPFQPGLTVLKAASLAGGFKERASFNKISIIRENDPKNEPQKVDINTQVNPGDTIFIEESFF
ncbi:MAG: polysaccharide export protein [Rhodoferax sp.]|jgi:protein involved in polysaccharide export with SLBB domain|uniref:polysaccharide biosynthesis/export family protein n=1 Tax=Rhodoferax sp. TaxID=50421 RepID=UPI001B60C706|nr:polysaccharide biosynthesis/export family protein [Rhodoferax sp.]MBP9149912.1 polysaccharide export protein [Rhodoferax sp.]MBP9736847.1 polysaccharide export protein [Rhodoferax sp.]